LRRIPVLHFYLDDTLEYVFKMEEVFRKLKEEKPTTPSTDTEAE
jgi:ribosome-binding factor A